MLIIQKNSETIVKLKLIEIEKNILKINLKKWKRHKYKNEI